MKTEELIEALEKLGQVYTGRDKNKPSEPVSKVIEFLKRRKEKTLDEIIQAARSGTLTKVPARKQTEVSAVARQYIDKLDLEELPQHEFEKIFEGVKTLKKEPLIQVAKGYTFRTKIDTKDKALVAIREEFFRRARERDRSRKEKSSLLM